MTIEEKRSLLGEILQGYGEAAVALSGGTDSSYLCAAARDELGARALAVTIASPLLAKSDLEDARRVAALVGVRHIIVEEEAIDEDVAANPKDRCYRCKKREFGAVIRAARGEGIQAVLDGSNVDDSDDYRPGMRALAELGVSSPLKDAGLRKKEIRELARLRGLPTWDKPAAACLASRVPYGERIEAAKLSRIEEAEAFIKGLGIKRARVRCHGDLARIEVGIEEREKLCDIITMDRVAAKLRGLGFLYVCMDLEGYSMGSLNRAIKADDGGPAR